MMIVIVIVIALRARHTNALRVCAHVGFHFAVLDDDEVKIIRGILNFNSKTVRDVLLPAPFRLSTEQVLRLLIIFTISSISLQQSGETKCTCFFSLSFFLSFFLSFA